MTREETADLLRSSRTKILRRFYFPQKGGRASSRLPEEVQEARMKNPNRILLIFVQDVPL